MGVCPAFGPRNLIEPRPGARAAPIIHLCALHNERGDNTVSTTNPGRARPHDFHPLGVITVSSTGYPR